MIIVNEIKDPRYLEVSAKAVDMHFKELGKEVGISNGFVIDSGIEYIYGIFICQVYDIDLPETNEECDIVLIHTRLENLSTNDVEVVVLDSPFF